MSMAGGNPSLIIDTMVNTALLSTGLRQAESQVAQSTANMARAADGFSKKWGQGIEAALFKFAGPMFAIQMGDRIARGIAEGIQKNETLYRTIENISYSFLESLPILGPGYSAVRKAAEIPGQGMTVQEAIFDLIVNRRIPVPEQLGGGSFQFGAGGGFREASGAQRQAQLEARIQRLQGALQQAQPQPTRSEMLSEQLSQQMGGAMGQAQTALGTFKFAQMGADTQAEIARNISKQVDLMIQIREATDELKKLSTSN